MKDRTLSVIIPNFRTVALTTLCLRLLAKNSDLARIKVIVVDNDSNDESLDYLRELDWIDLVERHGIACESGPEMHAKALDVGIRKVDTPFFMVMHTDTLMLDPGWYDYLMGKITSDDNIGGVGSWQLGQVSKLKALGKKLGDIARRLLGRKTQDCRRFLRSHCALYRTDVFRRCTEGFADGAQDGMATGENVHLDMEKSKYKMLFLPAKELDMYIRHFGLDTANPRASDGKSGKLPRELDTAEFRKILEDDSLDNPA